MDLSAAVIIGASATMAEAYSARPDAPVVPEPERRRRTREVRLSLSRALDRAARAVAPPAERCAAS